MLFGLFSAMALCNVAIYFVTGLFALVASNVIGKTDDFIINVSVFMVYISMVIAIANKSFSLIHLIPDQVMRWISNTANFGQYAGDDREVKQTFSQGTTGD